MGKITLSKSPTRLSGEILHCKRIGDRWPAPLVPTSGGAFPQNVRFDFVFDGNFQKRPLLCRVSRRSGLLSAKGGVAVELGDFVGHQPHLTSAHDIGRTTC